MLAVLNWKYLITLFHSLLNLFGENDSSNTRLDVIIETYYTIM